LKSQFIELRLKQKIGSNYTLYNLKIIKIFSNWSTLRSH